MLVKMASSNLVIKTVDRTNLFFNKFGYRVNVSGVPSAFYVQKCATVDDYLQRIEDNYIMWEEQSKRYNHHWYRQPLRPDEIDIEKIDNLLMLINAYKDKSIVTYRHEHENISVYTNDLPIAKLFAEKLNVSVITQVALAPDGVKLFKREPPAKYRAYTTNNKMVGEFKQDFLEYLNRTPDIRPSDAFYTYLRRNTINYQTWLWDTYFIDYDDEKNLMMMMLMFPGMIGKKYKLEKK